MKNLIVAAFVVCALIVSGAAFAEMLSGKIAATDAEKNSVSITKTNGENVDVLVKSGASFSGVTSFDQLKEGQDVTVEAEQDAATGAWNATYVEVSAPAEEAAPEAAPAQ